MTFNEQLNILDDKIKSNKAQYDLDREAAKISALSSKDLKKYEYLTLCITLINIVCPVLMKYHQLTLNLIQ